jgi:heat shock protein HtpX
LHYKPGVLDVRENEYTEKELKSMFRFMNNVKTAMLLAALMAVFMIAGHAIGGRNGMIFALFLGGGMNIVAYFFSDRIALMSMRAQPLSEAEAPEIHHIVATLAERAGIPKPRVYVATTPAPNAFATGRNPEHAVVCLTTGIMQTLSRDELAGVIGHELAHVKHYDMLIGTIAATIAGAISALGYLLWFIPIGSSDDDGNPLAAIAMIILAPIAAAIIQMAISRKREYNADSYGAELAGTPMNLATALERLQVENQRKPMNLPNPAQANLFIMKPAVTHQKMSSLFSTHPPVEKRVQALIGRPRTGMVY